MKRLPAVIFFFVTSVIYVPTYTYLWFSNMSYLLDDSWMESIKVYGRFFHPAAGLTTRSSGISTDISLERELKNFQYPSSIKSPQVSRRQILMTEKPKEITLKEYYQSKKSLYQKMRASEPIYKRSGYWLDLSYEVGNFTHESTTSQLKNELTINAHQYFDFSQAAALSMGKVIKGFMIGVSFRYRFPRSRLENINDNTIHKGRIPHSYSFSSILGYRIAPDSGVGMRIMLNTGYGFSPENFTDSNGQQYKYHYVMITPESKMDIKLISALVWSIGIAYQFNIQLSTPTKLMEKLFLQDNWNFSTGLAFSY